MGGLTTAAWELEFKFEPSEIGGGGFFSELAYRGSLVREVANVELDGHDDEGIEGTGDRL